VSSVDNIDAFNAPWVEAKFVTTFADPLDAIYVAPSIPEYKAALFKSPLEIP